MFTKLIEKRYLYFIKNIQFDDKKEKKKVVRKVVKKQLKKAPLPHIFWLLFTLGYHLVKLQRKAELEVENAIAARKIFYSFQVQKKMDQSHLQESLSDDDLAEKISLEKIDDCPLGRIYSKEELVKLMKKPIREEMLFQAAYFQKRPEDFRKIWKELSQLQSEVTPCDIDQVNLYYNQLKKEHALSHEDILQLIGGKVSRKKLTSIPLPELSRVFKDALDAVAS